MKKLAYHELMGVLRVGDLHPGGREATDFLLRELDKISPRHVLEVGAGMGLTTRRMLERGWNVTPIERSDVLREKVSKQLSIVVHPDIQTFEGDAAKFDAVIGEGVFYAFDPRLTLAKVGRLLRPGGLFATVEMTWTERANPEIVAFIHDKTSEVFGIPMVPRSIVTWAQWQQAASEAGFSPVAEARVKTKPPKMNPLGKAILAVNLLRHPLLVRQFLTYRVFQHIHWSPPEWLESWMSVWKRS